MDAQVYQGTLYKWTNYFQGWQPRWFVLESGILSYYLSQEEVKNGSRGSFKDHFYSTCQSFVEEQRIDIYYRNDPAHPSDPKQIVVTSTSGAVLYVKTSTTEDRQKWLIELGKAKQLAGSRMMEQTDGEDLEWYLRQNMAALHQTCKLLVEQITVVKETCSKTASIDVQLLEKKCCEVQETCDVFLGKLGNCMKVEEYMQRFVPLKRVKSNSKSEDGQSRTKTSHAVPTDIFYPLSSTPSSPTSPHTMSLPVPLGKGSTSSPKQSPKPSSKSFVSIHPRHQDSQTPDQIPDHQDGHTPGHQGGQTPGHQVGRTSSQQHGRTPGQQHSHTPHEQNVHTTGHQGDHSSIGSCHSGLPAHLKAHFPHHGYGSDRLSQTTVSPSTDNLVLGENEVSFGSLVNSPSISQHSRLSQGTFVHYTHSRSGSEAFITPASSPNESSPETPSDEDDPKEVMPFQDTRGGHSSVDFHRSQN